MDGSGQHGHGDETSIIRVAIVEDDPDLRAGLAAILGEGTGCRCLGAYASAEEALAHLLDPRSSQAGTPGPTQRAERDPEHLGSPDLVLMDIELPGIDGIEATRRLRLERPELDVVMLTVREDDDAVFRSLCAGAVGYLVKTTPPVRLLAAVREAHAGGAPLSPAIARKVTRSFQAVSPSPLSSRETEILGRLCEGKSYREIGTALFISERTVHSHLKNIYRKLEVHSKTEAMARAMRERWV